jgi:hypothetical protein
MLCAALRRSIPRPSTSAGPRRASIWSALLALALFMAAPAPAADAQLTSFELQRTDEGLLLDYTVNFELSRPVEDALAKAVPLYFVAEAEVLRERWYWRDKRLTRATRVWRVVYQPLTSSWRVTFGDLSQTFSTLSEALAGVRRAVAWRIAEPGQLEDGVQYVEFSFRLDTSQLPRPMQIGIAGQPEWTLAVERTQRLP